MSFKYIEGIALAEAAFEAKGKDLKELFTSCADAFIDTSANPKTIKSSKKIDISVKADDIEKLLYEFLEELVFLKDSEEIVFNKVNISQINEKSLKATAIGDKISPDKQELRADVKAITMHKFKVEKTKDGWKAMVVMDI